MRMKDKVDAVLHTEGLRCPLPIIKTAEKVKEMKPGQVLKVISDDPVIQIDMPAWCLSTSHEFLKVEEKDGVFSVFVRVKKG